MRNLSEIRSGQLTGNLPDKVGGDVGHFGGMDVEQAMQSKSGRRQVFVISNFRPKCWIFGAANVGSLNLLFWG